MGARITGRHFCGHDHAESDVWRLELTGSGRSRVVLFLFLKLHRRPRKLRQELAAYRQWAACLPDTPALLDVVERPGEPGALVLSACPGAPLDALAPLDPALVCEVHRRAGAFLRALHALPFDDADPLPLSRAIAERARAAAERARPHLEPALVDAVLARVDAGAPSFEGLRRVPCHRDFMPRNWLVELTDAGAAADGAPEAEGAGPLRSRRVVDAGALRVSFIDFEHAQGDVWLADLARLAAEVWPQAPALRDAFLEGYGVALAADDAARLELLGALHGLATVGWAVAHGDAAFERTGRAVLARLLAR